MDPKEKELEIQEDNQEEQEPLEDQEEEESTDDTDSEEESEEESGDEEGEEKPEEKPKDKAQKRIDQLTAAKKSLEEQLTESKEALDEAREKTKFLEDELVKSKQTYGSGVSNLWTRNGKHMYELTNKEYGEVVDMLVANAEASATDAERKQWMQQLKECNILRNTGQDIAEQEAQIERTEQELWENEWGLVSKALLETNPNLREHAEKLSKQIVPIFLNRKKDNESKFAYRKLTEGGVEAKFKHAVALMKKAGIYEAVEKEEYSKNPAPGKTVGKGAKSPAKGETRTFTRSQIAKMSMAEFEKNEAAINRAMKEGKVLDR